MPSPVKELIEENLARGFGINHGGPVYDVHLRGTSKISNYISGRVWHGSQRIERRKDGSVDLFMKTSGWKELVRFVLSWQPDMAVIAPVELRERIKQKMLVALKENY